MQLLLFQWQFRPLYKFEYRTCIDDRLCIIACLRDYRKNNLEGFTSDQFIFAVKNPFEGSSTNTIRRTENEILATNNIVDFYPQSCRVALTSKAKEINADVGEIIRRWCWGNRKNFYLSSMTKNSGIPTRRSILLTYLLKII